LHSLIIIIIIIIMEVSDTVHNLVGGYAAMLK